MDGEPGQRAKDLLDRLARQPRFAGGSEESRARSLCREELERAGFSVSEVGFDFSEWPARWGPPISGAVQLVIVLAMAGFAARDEPAIGLTVAAAAMILLGLVAGRMRRRGVLSFPHHRSRSVNLEAVRGNPVVWLVAHLDTKSQTVPMLVRISGAMALHLVSAVVLLAVLAHLAGFRPPQLLWPALAAVVVIAALPVVLCLVGNESPGAVDNATGVAAVVLAASSPELTDVGVLITSAEELGLAGARSRANTTKKHIRVINCDSVDDAGGWRCMYTGDNPESITSAVMTVGARLGMPVRVGRLIPGIMADSIAFTDAGIQAVTISRGTVSTLARIHTWRDTSIGLTGTGAADASVLLSALAKELS